MAETAGENLVFIILFVIFIFVIVLVFAYFLLFGFGFSDSTTCYGSANVANFFYNDLCVTQLFCIASTLQGLGITPPLLGCSPSTQSYSSTSTPAQALTGLTQSLSTCWYQYGGPGNTELSVLPGASITGAIPLGSGTGLCSVTSLNLNQNFTFYTLTHYLSSTTFTTEVACINPQESCENPESSSNPNGFTCSSSGPTPNECTSSSSNYFQCKDQQGYIPILEGETLQTLFLYSSNPNVLNTAANNASDLICQESAGCNFVPTTSTSGECEDSSGNPATCSQLYNNFCETNANGTVSCILQYDPSDNEFSDPNTCTLTEPIKNTSIVNISYAGYLAPGVNLIYNIKNKSNGTQGTFVSPYSNVSIKNAQIYIVFLNSFAGSSYPPQGVSTPSECAPQEFLNNYPTNGIADNCGRALAIFGTVGVELARSKPSLNIMGGAAGAGLLFGECNNNKVCNKIVSTPAVNAFSTGLYNTTGLAACAQSLEAGLSQLGTYIWSKGTSSESLGLSFLGRDQMYLCAVTS